MAASSRARKLINLSNASMVRKPADDNAKSCASKCFHWKVVSPLESLISLLLGAVWNEIDEFMQWMFLSGCFVTLNFPTEIVLSAQRSAQSQPPHGAQTPTISDINKYLVSRQRKARHNNILNNLYNK